MACSYGIYDNLAFTLTVAYSLDIPIYGVIIAKIIIFYENTKGKFVQTFSNLTF